MHQGKSAQSLFWFTALILTFALSLSIDRPFLAHSRKLFLTDFRAFYCAGYVHAKGADPYLVEPLRSCEHRVAPDGDPPGNIVVPAPLPGYDIALFSLLAALPFPIAATLWELSLVCAFIATIVALIRLTAIEAEVVFSCLLFSDLLLSLSLGQMVPISVAALSGAMLALSRQRFVIAAILASISLIEPHLGLGATLALMLLVPQARSATILCGGAIALLSLHTMGLESTHEYLRSVLPAHVISETANEEQYGLTPLFSVLGCTNVAASLLGSFAYATLVGIGVACGGKLARQRGEPAFLIATPTLFALIGSPFLHIHQMAAAIPAALLAHARIPRQKRLSGAALLLLAVPWTRFHVLFLLTFTLAAIMLLLSARLLHAPLPGQLLIAAIAFSIVFTASMAFTPPGADLSAISPVPSNALAESVWSSYITLHHAQNRLMFLLLKIPTWAALLATATTLSMKTR